MVTPVGKQFTKFILWYEQTENDISRHKTFKTLTEVKEWLKENDPWYWRLDQDVKIIIDGKDANTHVIDIS